MLNKRGATLTELVIVMAVVGIMSVMVVSFTILCNSWVTLGIKRYNAVRDSQLFSKSYHQFVTQHDVAGSVFSVSNDGRELKAVVIEDGVEKAYAISFDYENKTLRFIIDNEIESDSYIPIDDIDDVSFGLVQGTATSKPMIYASLEYTFVTPGKKVQEQERSYKTVISLRMANSDNNSGD